MEVYVSSGLGEIKIVTTDSGGYPCSVSTENRLANPEANGRGVWHNARKYSNAPEKYL